MSGFVFSCEFVVSAQATFFNSMWLAPLKASSKLVCPRLLTRSKFLAIKKLVTEMPSLCQVEDVILAL